MTIITDGSGARGTFTIKSAAHMTWLDYLAAIRIPRTPRRKLWVRNLQDCARR